MRKKKIKEVRPEVKEVIEDIRDFLEEHKISISPMYLIIPPDVTTYLYKMGYRTQEEIISMVSNLVMNGR